MPATYWLMGQYAKFYAASEIRINAIARGMLAASILVSSAIALLIGEQVVHTPMAPG